MSGTIAETQNGPSADDSLSERDDERAAGGEEDACYDDEGEEDEGEFDDDKEEEEMSSGDEPTDKPIDAPKSDTPPAPAKEVGLGLVEQMIAAEKACHWAERSVHDAKAELKDAKTTYDACVSKLRSLARAMMNDADRPLLNQVEQAAPAATPVAEPVADESWKEVSIVDLDLPDGILNMLYGADVETVGQLEQLRSEISLGRKSWPKGIGPAKITLVEGSVLDWLKDFHSRSSQGQVTDDQAQQDGEEAAS